MHVQMENGLAGALADVEHGAIAIFDGALAGNVRGGEVAAPDEFGIFGRSFLQSGDMLFGDDENVGWALWVEVFEGEGVCVFIYFFGRHFAANDATEKTISHDFTSRYPRELSPGK